jgi:hypothetical protein
MKHRGRSHQSTLLVMLMGILISSYPKREILALFRLAPMRVWNIEAPEFKPFLIVFIHPTQPPIPTYRMPSNTIRAWLF